MIDPKYYSCDYCHKEYEPTRRRVQKYCSNTCRSKAWNAKQQYKTVETNKQSPDLTIPKSIPTIPKKSMSATGIGDAAAGSLIAEGVKAILTPSKNKAATKSDIDLLVEKLDGRYHLITNLERDAYGNYPYYDMQEGVLVYLKWS